MSDTYKRRLSALLHGLTITMLLAPMPAVAADPVPPRARVSTSAATWATCSATARPRWPTRSAFNRPAAPPRRHLLRRRAGRLRASLRSRLMLGVELDMSFAIYATSPTCCRTARQPPAGQRAARYLSSLRGRAGCIGSWTPFVTGGIPGRARATHVPTSPRATRMQAPATSASAWTVGSGLDYRLDPRWTTRFEYLYTNLGLSGQLFGAAPARYNSQYDLHQFRVGLNYKFGAEDEKKEKEDDRGPGSWRCTARPPSSTRAIRRFPRSIAAPTACRREARAAKPGQCQASSARGSGRAVSSISIPSCCRASASPTPPVPRAIPTARHRSRTSPIHNSTSRACSCARRSGWAARPRRSRASTASSRA